MVGAEAFGHAGQLSALQFSHQPANGARRQNPGKLLMARGHVLANPE
jgi:hypothetical protein